MNVNKDNIGEFIKSQKFTDQLFVSIFKKIMEKHKNETLRQTAIRSMIEIYESKYDVEMRRHSKNIRERKENRANEYAVNKEQDMRILFTIPDTLFARLQNAVEISDPGGPGFMTQESFDLLKEDVWFAKNFKQYMVAEKY